MKDLKAALRKEMKSLRAGLAAANPRAGAQLAEVFAAQGQWPEAPVVVAGFHPMQSEIDPLPLMHLLHERGHRLALPALVPATGGSPHGPNGGGLDMIFRPYLPAEPLQAGPYGIWQPSADRAEVRPDIVLVPLLAFDLMGGRLGYGGGFYDRALGYLKAQKPAKEAEIKLWGIGFAGQMIAAVPCEPHDQRLDAILTEQDWYEIRKT